MGGGNAYFPPCPISHVPVVVCRLAGIRTRGRSLVRKKPAAGANRRTPPNGGRDLKQRRTGLFRLCRPSKGRRTEEACLSCRACGAGAHPLPNDGHHTLDGGFRYPGQTCPRRSTRSCVTRLNPSAGERTITVGGSTESPRLHRAGGQASPSTKPHRSGAKTAPFEGMPR
jgi:hypothetical protein